MAHAPALSHLTEQLNYTFKDESLLEQALTHKSSASKNNERLEFLGDGILNFVIAEALYCQFPDYSEGDLSRLRAHLVNGDMLAEIARGLQLGDFMRLGAGELKSGGFRRTSILADGVESILGAVYCDSGYAQCSQLIHKLFKEKLKHIPAPQSLRRQNTSAGIVAIQKILDTRL